MADVCFAFQAHGAEDSLHEQADELDPSKYFANRMASIDALKAKGLNPYPHKFNVSLSLNAFIAKVCTLLKDLYSWL